MRIILSEDKIFASRKREKRRFLTIKVYGPEDNNPLVCTHTTIRTGPLILQKHGHEIRYRYCTNDKLMQPKWRAPGSARRRGLCRADVQQPSRGQGARRRRRPLSQALQRGPGAGLQGVQTVEAHPSAPLRVLLENTTTTATPVPPPLVTEKK
jgi:hypothetical protein